MRIDGKPFSYYRDFVLGVIGGFSLLWGLVAGWEYYYRGNNPFDRNTAVICVSLTTVTILLSPNRMKVFAGNLGVVAGIAIGKYLFSGDKRALVVTICIFVIGAVVGGINGIKRSYKRKDQMSKDKPSM